jgi:hypothetical protein
MERRRAERISVTLKAALLDDTAMPKGCRVRDFSPRGMLLQYEYDSNVAAFDHGDTLTVRLSLREADERKVITLPSTVRRVEPNGIGVEFLKPEPALLELLEPYRLDDRQTGQVSLEDEHTAVAAGGRPSFSQVAASRPRFRRDGGAAGHTTAPDRTARPRAVREYRARHAAVSAAAVGETESANIDRKLFYVGLASLVFAGFILVFDLADGAGTEGRLSALEATTRHHAQALSEMPTSVGGGGAVSDEALARLGERVDTLAVSIAALETRLAPSAPERRVAAGDAPEAKHSAVKQQPEAEVGAVEVHSDRRGAAAAVAAVVDAASEAVTPAAEAGAPAPAQGPWLINLASSSSEAAAEQFVTRAAAQGIRVEPSRATVNGREVWRLQITGFATREEARSYGAIASRKLGLKDVWVYRR